MRGRVIAAAGLFITALCAGTGPANAGIAPWTEVPADTVSNQNFLFRGVAAPGVDDVWAVGYHWEYVGGALEFRTLAEHYAGGRFSVVPTPDRVYGGLAKDFLAAATSTSPTDVWAVGYSLPAGIPEQTLVEHWDGSAWSIVASPNPGAFGDELDGVDAQAADDIWAVGARKDGFYQTPMAQHWNGSSWSSVAVPNPAGCTGHSLLTAVSTIAPRNVWAVGWCQASGVGDEGYVVHWNGRRWSIVAPPGVVPAPSELAAVSAAGPHSVWIAGEDMSSAGQPAALVMRWDGTSWTRLPVAAPQDQANFYAVLGGRGTAGWAFGAGPSPQPPFAGPASVRFTHGAGNPVAVPRNFGSLHAIIRDPAGTLWAVGQSLETQWDLPLVVRRPGA